MGDPTTGESREEREGAERHATTIAAGTRNCPTIFSGNQIHLCVSVARMPTVPPLTPPDAFHLEAAIGWLLLENAREARAELEQLSPAYREHPDVLESWWKVFSEEKNWPAAFECGAKLSVVMPSRAMGWIAQSFALHELKRTREAYELLHSVVGRFREHFVIPYNLACYQCQLGNKDDALQWLQRAVDVADAKTIREMALNDGDLAPLREAIARLI